MHPETPAPIPSVPLMTGFQRSPKQPGARVAVSTTPPPGRGQNGANMGELTDADHVLSSLGYQLRRWRDRGVPALRNPHNGRIRPLPVREFEFERISV